MAEVKTLAPRQAHVLNITRHVYDLVVNFYCMNEIGRGITVDMPITNHVWKIGGTRTRVDSPRDLQMPPVMEILGSERKAADGTGYFWCVKLGGSCFSFSFS